MNNNSLAYFEKSEIYGKYQELIKKLESDEKLSKEEILEISNIYKKIVSSIDYIDSQNSLGDTYVIDELPEMDGLYTEIPEKIIELLLNESALAIPENAFDFQAQLILEQYLTATEQTPLEKIKIVQLEDGRYSVMSNEGEFYFDMYIYSDEDGSLYISPETELEENTVKELSRKGISITDTGNKIPKLNSKNISDSQER